MLREARKAVIAMREMERTKSYPFWNARDEWVFIINEPGKAKVLARGVGSTPADAVIAAMGALKAQAGEP